MKLSVRHTYPCSVERYWEMYWDDDFDEELQRDSTVIREVLENVEEAGILRRRLRFTSRDDLPTMIAKVVGSPKLSYEQVNLFKKAESSMLWEVLQDFVSSDRFNAKGSFVVIPKGEGCELQIDGEINVKVRFIGSQIESKVVAQIEEAYENMRKASLTWLQEHPIS